MKIDNTVIQNLRKDYQAAAFDLADAAPDPVVQFGKWFREALDAEVLEPNAMTLATASPDGVPHARIVLLKGVDESGFVFYTNYGSAKGRELEQNPRAALVFVWLELQRQVRIEGRVERVSAEESAAYFQSRPKGSQIGAYASPQSQPIASRQVLEDNVTRLTAEYAAADALPLPDFWGGYRVIPTQIEFWQGRSSRLHDRIVYTPDAAGEGWTRTRLAP